jgi:GTP diphosphokinase / guanosine-3',5'-bis(diphosphate) 3'-diphosphatase
MGGRVDKDRDKIGREKFAELLGFRLTSSELRRVMRAYKLAKYGHKDQLREDGERYFEHPKAVALILIQELRIIDADTIIAALMHDLQEDSFILSWEDIEDIFGKDVSRYVRAVTKEPNKDYLGNLLEAPTPALFVKLADRLHNLRTLGACRPEKQLKKRARNIFRSLKSFGAAFLGMKRGGPSI